MEMLFWYTQHWEEQSLGKPFVRVRAVPDEQRQYFVMFEYNEALSDLLRTKWDHFRYHNQCAMLYYVHGKIMLHLPYWGAHKCCQHLQTSTWVSQQSFGDWKRIHQTLLIATTFLTMEPGVWICMRIKYHSANGHNDTILQSEKGTHTGKMLTHHILPNSPNNKSDELSPNIHS